MERPCEDCTLCCKVLRIAELNKPDGQWCPHCDPAQGCRNYNARPWSCRHFECLWMQNGGQPTALKPSTLHAVIYLAPDGSTVRVVTDRDVPEVWRQEPLRGILKRLSENETVALIEGPRKALLRKRCPPCEEPSNSAK